MARYINTSKDGKSWSNSQKLAIWSKGNIISELDKGTWRNDKCGKKIKWHEHGNRNSKYGWEIDHINPVSNGGSDNPNNLQPLHWKNNTYKADNLNWTCP